MKFSLLGFLFFSQLTMAAPISILFVGDSHSVGPFGQTLDKLLRTIPDSQVASYASCGSIAKWWYTGATTSCGYFFHGEDSAIVSGTKGPTPLFSPIFLRLKPHLTVVELGANYAGMPSDDFAINDMKRMAKEIRDGGSECLWVTKPDSRDRSAIPRILKLTKDAVGEYCTIFDSTKVTTYPATGGDGVHYWNTLGTPIAKKWASLVFDKVNQLLNP